MLPAETPGTFTRNGGLRRPGGLQVSQLKGAPMIDLQVGLHVFMSVLILGTIFRIVSYHLMASPNPGIQHIGKAMSTQY